MLSQDPGYGTWPMYRPPQACPTSREKAKPKSPKGLDWLLCLQASGFNSFGASASSSATAASHCDEAHFQFRLPLHFGPHRQQCVLTYRSSSATTVWARYRRLPAFSAAATGTPTLHEACLKRTGDAPGISRALLSHQDTISINLPLMQTRRLGFLADSG